MTVSAAINSNAINDSQRSAETTSLEMRYITEKPTSVVNENTFPLFGKNPNLFVDNSSFSAFLSKWRFKDINTVYRQIQKDSRILPLNEMFKNLINEYFNGLFFENLFNIYRNSPSYFNILFPVMGGKFVISSNVHVEYQVYYYLICMIDYVNKNLDSDMLVSLPNVEYDIICEWCKTRKDVSIEYTIRGPLTNSEIDPKIHKRYSAIISASTQTQTNIIEYLSYSKLENLQNELSQFSENMTNRNNSYVKLSDDARQYIINIDTLYLRKKYIENNILYFDLSGPNYGDTSEQNTQARIENIEKVKITNVTDSRINIKKLETIFNMFSLLNIQKLIVDKYTYKTDLSVLNHVYLVFKGIACSTRTINADVMTGDLMIGGNFITNNDNNFVFVPDNEFTSYRENRTFVNQALVYFTTSPNDETKNLIVPNIVDLTINNIDVYNFPIQLRSTPAKDITYITFWEQNNSKNKYTQLSLLYDCVTNIAQMIYDSTFNIEAEFVNTIGRSSATISGTTIAFDDTTGQHVDLSEIQRNTGGVTTRGNTNDVDIYGNYNVYLQHYVEIRKYYIYSNILKLIPFELDQHDTSAVSILYMQRNVTTSDVNNIRIYFPFTNHYVENIPKPSSDIESITYRFEYYNIEDYKYLNVSYTINGDKTTRNNITNIAMNQPTYPPTVEKTVYTVTMLPYKKVTTKNGISTMQYMYVSGVTSPANVTSLVGVYVMESEISTNGVITLTFPLTGTPGTVLTITKHDMYNITNKQIDKLPYSLQYTDRNHVNPFIMEDMLLYNLDENEINTIFSTINLNKLLDIKYTPARISGSYISFENVVYETYLVKSIAYFIGIYIIGDKLFYTTNKDVYNDTVLTGDITNMIHSESSSKHSPEYMDIYVQPNIKNIRFEITEAITSLGESDNPNTSAVEIKDVNGVVFVLAVGKDYYTMTEQQNVTIAAAAVDNIPYIQITETNIEYTSYPPTIGSSEISNIFLARIQGTNDNRDTYYTLYTALAIQPITYKNKLIYIVYDNASHQFYFMSENSIPGQFSKYIATLDMYVHLQNIDVYVQLRSEQLTMYIQTTVSATSIYYGDYNIGLPASMLLYQPPLSYNIIPNNDVETDDVDTDDGAAESNIYMSPILSPFISNNIDKQLFYIYDYMNLHDMTLPIEQASVTKKIGYYMKLLNINTIDNMLCIETPKSLSQSDYIQIYGSQYNDPQPFIKNINVDTDYMINYIHDKLYSITNISPKRWPEEAAIIVKKLFIYLFKSDMRLTMRWL